MIVAANDDMALGAMEAVKARNLSGIAIIGFDALPEGGAVVIFSMIGADNDSGPLSAALGSPYFLAIATGEGMLYSWKDYEAMLRDAGFEQTIRLDRGLPLDHGILIGVK